MLLPTRLTATALAVALAVAALPGLLTTHAQATSHRAATPSTALPHQLIVGYKPGTPQATSDQAVKNSLHAQQRATPTYTFERRLATGAVLLSLPDNSPATALTAAAKQLAANPDVAYAEPDHILQTTAEPNDPRWGEQWDLWDEYAGMNVPPAWPRATGNGVTVAVIDSGYATHSDLEANVVDGYDFLSHAPSARDGDGRDPDYHDPGNWAEAGACAPGTPARDSDWHGTHVAGTIAAQTDNAKGVASTAHDAKVQPVRVGGACGALTSDIAEAIIWAAGGTVPGVPANKTPAKVINMSIGGPAPCATITQLAINYAVSRGTTVVTSAGNANADAATNQPGNCDNVITVAASDRHRNRGSYSNYGAAVEITAPGGTFNDNPADGILSTHNTGTTTPGQETYHALVGTSMAAPHISALAALILQLRPDHTPAQVQDVITTTASPITSCGDDCGAGLADATAAVRSLT
ncbi:S8 family peptidase [Streptomyces sp. UH6]|uniref:S8 family peptidase n=1 Tax=Streptomyces sp. UH6 TaxID=2748379 RepID=UPI0015D4DFED|nr:S8 family peptidase [Streptomyces sp. UH6]NYV72832.1 S8 family peptidase [Streptomyces sp. UH6]